MTFGRFFAKPDMNVGISYRTPGDPFTGIYTEVEVRRHSFMMEAYKNLFNYLGFVPYAGVTILGISESRGLRLEVRSWKPEARSNF